MGRRTPWNLKNPKYQNPDGSLKDGYTYHPVNEGYSKVGEIKTQKRTGAGVDGTNYKITGARTIYKDGPSPKTVHAPAPAPAPTPAPPPPPKPAPAPVVHSPEIQQAKERVSAYESDIKRGNPSEDIYNTGSNATTNNPSEDIYNTGSNTTTQDRFIKPSSSIFNKQFDFSGNTFDASKGAAGIGTLMNNDSNQQASKAAASFLDKKVSDVKSKQQFQTTSLYD